MSTERKSANFLTLDDEKDNRSGSLNSKPDSDDDLLNLDDVKDNNTQPIELVLKRSNGTTIVSIPRNSARHSGLFRNALEVEPTLTKIDISNDTNPSTLTKLMWFFKYYENVEPPLIKAPLHTNVLSELKGMNDEVISYLTMNFTEVQALLHLSHQLDVTSLESMLCAKVACLLKGKPIENFKAILEAVLRSIF